MRSNATNDGRSFQGEIEATLAQYEHREIMRARKVDPPLRYAGPGRLIHCENPFLDYIGAWTAQGGRMLAFEAKSTKQGRLPLARDGGLTEKQFKALRCWRASGAVAFLLWQNKEAGKVRLYTVPELVAASDGGRNASIAWTDAAGVFVRQGDGFVLHDFAPVLNHLINKQLL